MTTPDLRAAAHLIAKLLARRPTPPEEVAGLIHSVHGALSRLGEEHGAPEPLGEEEEPPALPAPERPRTTTPRRRRRIEAEKLSPAEPEEAAAAAPPPPPPAPKLVRRAEVAPQPQPTPTPPAVPVPTGGTVRGVVKWFDQRSGKGALRLRGFAGDVALEARHLSESGIPRLFKGQEIEATVGGDTHAPVLERVAVLGTAAPRPVGSGVVHSRRAKPVLVELKREALRRAAARAEAEHLLGPTRSR
jgi:cold shock CspA family protein